VGCAQSFLVAPNKPFSLVTSITKPRACASPSIVLKANLDTPGAETNPASINGEAVLRTFREYAQSPKKAIVAATIALGAITLMLQKAVLQLVWQTVGPLSAIAAIGALVAGTLPLAVLPFCVLPHDI
jgi:hypothetical protein